MKILFISILIINLAIPLPAQHQLAPAGMTSVPSEIPFNPAKGPYQLHTMNNFPDKCTYEFDHYDLLQERFPKVYYCPKRERWVCDDTPPYVTTKKVIAIKPSSRDLMWINRAINALDEEVRQKLLKNPETRLIFLNDYHISEGKELDYIDRNDFFEGFYLNFPIFFLDERHIHDPLELINSLMESSLKRSYILANCSKNELDIIHSTGPLNENQKKTNEILNKLLDKLVNDVKINTLIKFEKDVLVSLYQKDPLLQDTRQQLLKRTIRRYHEKQTEKKPKDFVSALRTLTDVLLDQNATGHKEARRIVKTHEHDFINLIKLSPKDQNIMIAEMDLLSAYRKSYSERKYEECMKTFFLTDLMPLITNAGSSHELQSSALRLFRYCGALASVEGFRSHEKKLFTTLKKIINTSKDSYLKADAIMALWALVSQTAPIDKKFFSFLAEKAPLFEKYVLQKGEPCLEKAGLLALEVLWRKVKPYPEKYNKLLTRYIFKNDAKKKSRLRRGPVYGTVNLRKGAIPDKLPTTLVTILQNDDYVRRLITVLTVLRLAYPFTNLHDDPRSPLEWASTFGAYNINELYFTPVSQSFRRFIFFDFLKDITLELKIPGERESSNIIPRKNYLFAKQQRRLHPDNDPEVVKPLFFMTLQGVFDMYEPWYPAWKYDETNPFGILAFEYKERKRLGGIIVYPAQWDNFVNTKKHFHYPDLKKPAVSEKLYSRICADVFLHIARRHRAGFITTKKMRGNHTLSDCHLGNFCLYKNGRVVDICDYGTATRNKKLFKKYRDQEIESIAEDLFSAINTVVDIQKTKQEFFLEILDTVINDTMRSISRKKARRTMLNFLEEEFKPAAEKLRIHEDIFNSVITTWRLYIEKRMHTIKNGPELRKELIEYAIRERATARAGHNSKFIFHYKYEGLRLINNVLAADKPENKRRIHNLFYVSQEPSVAEIFAGKNPPSIMFIVDLQKTYWKDIMGIKDFPLCPFIAHHRHDEHQYIFDFSILEMPDKFKELLMKEIEKRRMLAKSPVGKELAILSLRDLYNPIKRKKLLNYIGSTAAELLSSL